MDATLIELKAALEHALRRPDAAVGQLPSVLARLSGYTEAHPEAADAWRLRSLAEERLLHHVPALASFEKALDLSHTRDRQDVMRLVRLREQAARWIRLVLSPAQLAELGEFLDGEINENGCDHTLALTECWLQEQRAPQAVLDALREIGGYCDCEVRANVVEG